MRRRKLNNPCESLEGFQLKKINDEEEDDGMTQEAKNQQEHHEKQLKGSNNDNTYLQAMTKEELHAHVQRCLEMSSENKITPKNAFALGLIDCMGVFLQQKIDFSTMACTLDAGAKIYSNRVDALYKQVTKLADEVILHQKKEKKCNDENTNEVEENINKKEIKKNKNSNKKSTIVSSESLKRKVKGKDPKDRFIKLDPVPGGILSKVRRDPNDLSFTLENNVPFWPNWENYKPLKAEGTVLLPRIQIFREKKRTIDSQQNIFGVTQNNIINTITEVNINEIIGENQMLSQDDPISNSDVEDQEHNEESVNFHSDNDKQSDGEVEVISTAIKRINEEAEKGGLICKTNSRFEAMKLLFRETSDYDHLDIRNAYYWAGPEFWKRPTRGLQNVNEKRNIPKNKNKPKEISYNNISSTEINEKWNKLFKKGQTYQKIVVSKRTVQGWSNKKLTLPKDVGIGVNEFIDLFHISRLCKEENTSKLLESTPKSTENSENYCLKEIGTVIVDLSDDSDPLNSSFYEGPLGGNSVSSENEDPLNSAFYDVGLVHSSGIGSSKDAIKVQVFPNNSPTTDEDTLVPVPKIVKYQPIKYSTKPIRVDMLHLKESMLNIIDQEIENSSAQNNVFSNPGSSGADNNSFTPGTKFSNILHKLPDQLERRTAEDVSPAIAFVALLTLANENNLVLKECENYSDIIVQKEDE